MQRMPVSEEGDVSRPAGPQLDLGRILVSTTLCSMVCSLLNLAVQVAIARRVGAGPEMDAYLAASTLPQYLLNLVTTPAASVFLPFFVVLQTERKSDDAWHLASAVINICVAVTVVCGLSACWLGAGTLQVVTPGLAVPTRELAVRLGWLVWPSIAVAVLSTLLAAVCRAREHFVRAAVVPVAGYAVNLAVVVAFGALLGIVVVPVAYLANVLVQTALFLPSFPATRYRFTLGIAHPSLREVVRQALPLTVSNVFSQSIGIMERAITSTMPAGCLSQLGYANRLYLTVAAQISAGLPTIGFPVMARSYASEGKDSLRHDFQALTRAVWIVVAPVMACCVVLAHPISEALLVRGAFTPADANSVAGLLQAYSLGMAGACFGVLVGRVCYVLGRGRMVAVMGVIEVLFYAAVLPVLSGRFGVIGVALSTALLLNVAVLTYYVLLRVLLGRGSWRRMVGSLSATGAIAGLAGAAGWYVAGLPLGAWSRTLGGAAVVLLGYAALLFFFRAAELTALRSWLKVAREDGEEERAP